MLNRTAVRRVVGAIVVGFVILSAPAPGLTQQRRDAVTIGMAQEPDLLGPFSIMTASAVIENAIYGYIAPFTDKWVRMPVTVDKLPTLKDGDWVLLPNKKMKVTWRLKRGWTWHDGKPVTALDWRFTYGMLRNPQTPIRSRFVLNKVDNILVPNPDDPYEMTVQWNELWPFAGSDPFGGDGYPLPRHILERPYLSDPSKLKADPYWRKPIGNGPYRVIEWVPGSHISLEAYDRFPLGTPAIKLLTFRFILDSTVLQANTIAGGVDATEVNNFNCLQMDQIAQRNPRVNTHYREAMSWERVDFNLDDVWLKDRRVRQAIAHALDRKALADVWCPDGRQPVAHSWLPPAHPGAHPNVKKYDYDPARAETLLREAGFTKGADGILRDTSGRRVEMTIMTTAGHSAREQVEQIIKEQLRQVGIDIRIDNRPSSVFLGRTLPQRQFPHLAMVTTTFSTESMPFDRFHSTQIPSAANNWAGNNRTGWRNAENDRLWEQLISEMDAQRRIALLRRQQEIFAEDLPTLPLLFVLRLSTSPKAMRGPRPTGLSGSYLLWNSWEWKWGDQ